MGQWWDDTDREKWDNGGMILTGGNRSIQTKACPSATLFPIHPTQTGLGSNPGIRGERSATNLHICRMGGLKYVYLTQDRNKLRDAVSTVVNP